MRRYNESPSHERQKERVGRIFSDKGWTVYVDSYPFTCKTEKGERTYWPDVYAESPEYTEQLRYLRYNPGVRLYRRPGERPKRIIVEIQGSKGKGDHSTKIHRGKDRNRLEDILQAHGNDICYCALHLWAIKGATDQEIWEEIEYVLKNEAQY